MLVTPAFIESGAAEAVAVARMPPRSIKGAGPANASAPALRTVDTPSLGKSVTVTLTRTSRSRLLPSIRAAALHAVGGRPRRHHHRHARPSGGAPRISPSRRTRTIGARAPRGRGRGRGRWPGRGRGAKPGEGRRGEGARREQCAQGVFDHDHRRTRACKRLHL
jgi:hypothetical protein